MKGQTRPPARRRRIRTFARDARRVLKEYGWLILGIMGVGALALCYLGFRELPASKEWSVSDTLYRALQLFVLTGGDVDPPVPTFLEWGRWSAWLVTTLAAAGAVLLILREQTARLRGRMARRHVIICGLGRCGTRLAIGFRSQGYRVVAIEIQGAASGVEAARREGVTVLVANAVEQTTLRRAGIARAKYLFAVCGDDGINVDIAVNADDAVSEDRSRPLACFAQVVDTDVRRYLRELAIRSPKSGVFRLNAFEVSELGTPGLLAAHPAFDVDGDAVVASPRIGLIGLGQTGSQILLALAQRWATAPRGQGQRLPVAVLDRRADELAESFLRRYRGLAGLVELTPMNEDVDAPLFPTDSLAKQFAAPHHPRTIYICLDDEVRALRTALIVRRFLDDADVPIVVRTTNRSKLSTYPVGLDDDPRMNVSVFPMLDRVCTPEVMLGGMMNEILAQTIHYEYLRHERERGDSVATNPSLLEWDALPEALKDSNRSQASHIGSKLRAIGLDITALAEVEEEPRVAFTPSEIERLAEIEHKRWWAERQAAGWSLALTKNADRKESPWLIPWEKLPEEMKERDRDVARGLPVVLAKAGYAVVRVGIKEDAGALISSGSVPKQGPLPAESP